MCDCYKPDILENSVTVTYSHQECRGITVDLLQMYLRPVECCLNNSIFETVNCTRDELEDAKLYLENYITAKQADPETCQYKNQLSFYQNIIQRIIITGICL